MLRHHTAFFKDMKSPNICNRNTNATKWNSSVSDYKQVLTSVSKLVLTGCEVYVLANTVYIWNNKAGIYLHSEVYLFRLMVPLSHHRTDQHHLNSSCTAQPPEIENNKFIKNRSWKRWHLTYIQALSLYWWRYAHNIILYCPIVKCVCNMALPIYLH